MGSRWASRKVTRGRRSPLQRPSGLNLDATGEIPANFSPARATPFVAGVAALPTVTTEPRGPSHDGHTALGCDRIAAIVGASMLPFVRPTESETGGPPPSTSPAAEVAPVRGVQTALATEDLPQLIRVRWPFSPGGTARAAGEVVTGGRECTVRLMPESGDATLETARPQVGDVLPFRGGSVATGDDLDEPLGRPRPNPVARGPELTLEQYASLRAELAASPSDADALHRRYGVVDPGAVHAAWTQRLRGDSALGEQFQVLLQRYAAWLARRPP
jgi:hypothetical protein